jgi:hypothetical protein
MKKGKSNSHPWGYGTMKSPPEEKNDFKKAIGRFTAGGPGVAKGKQKPVKKKTKSRGATK